MSGHTAGPWVVSCGSIAGMSRALDDSSLVVITGRDAIAVFSGNEETREANANLVAAAPDLLAALYVARDQIREFLPTALGEALTTIEAAIARAEGKP